MLHNFVTWLTSPLVGFLLKLLGGLAAAAFGVLGVGVKTRNDNGELNRNGWVALVGILVGGVLAVGSSVYDFIGGQKKEADDRLRQERLMLSVQRNLYPMRGLKAEGEISLSGDSIIDAYKHLIRDTVSRDPFCKSKRSGFECSPFRSPGSVHPDYLIGSDSPLFPGDKSEMAGLLGQLYFLVRLAAQHGPSVEGDDRPRATFLGSFEVDLRDAPRKFIGLTYKYDSNNLVLSAFNIPIEDDFVAVGGAYSLVDFFPGFVVVEGGIGDEWCQPKGIDHDNCSDRVERVERELRPLGFRLIFPYDKSIRLSDLNYSNPTATNCDIDDRHQLVMDTPQDVEQIDSFGNVRGAQLPPSTQACKEYAETVSQRGK